MKLNLKKMKFFRKNIKFFEKNIKFFEKIKFFENEKNKLNKIFDKK